MDIRENKSMCISTKCQNFDEKRGACYLSVTNISEGKCKNFNPISNRCEMCNRDFEFLHTYFLSGQPHKLCFECKLINKIDDVQSAVKALEKTH